MGCTPDHEFSKRSRRHAINVRFCRFSWSLVIYSKDFLAPRLQSPPTRALSRLRTRMRSHHHWRSLRTASADGFRSRRQPSSSRQKIGNTLLVNLTMPVRTGSRRLPRIIGAQWTSDRPRVACTFARTAKRDSAATRFSLNNRRCCPRALEMECALVGYRHPHVETHIAETELLPPTQTLPD
jgi:hypothetical protein